jgi:hypothetical protein
MNANLSGGSARIYQFPKGGRDALQGRPYDTAAATPDLSASSRVNEADCAGSWYHAAAIQDSKPVREC